MDDTGSVQKTLLTEYTEEPQPKVSSCDRGKREIRLPKNINREKTSFLPRNLGRKGDVPQMKEPLTTLIREYRMGNSERLLPIIEQLKPAICKYARKLYRNDFEDSISELELALLESVNRIPYVENEAQCLTFLINALKNKYRELARIHSKILSNELPLEEACPVCPYWEKEYGDCELRLVLEDLLSSCSTKQKIILMEIIFEGKSCSLVAAELHTTRQYVNRIKNKWLEQIKSKIFTEGGERNK